jgi:hypothetical protein
MQKLTEDSLARCILSCEYTSHLAQHVDHYYCDSVNLWRDFFPPDQLDILLGMRVGESRILIKEEQTPYDPSLYVRIRHNQWQPPGNLPTQVKPKVGRWYPQGFVSGVANIYPQTLQPLRIVEVTEENIGVDCNHPLAGTNLTVRVIVEDISSQLKERGGRCVDWIEDALADGPGMQRMHEHECADYSEVDAFKRSDEQRDSDFYLQPRMVSHLDSQAQKHLLRHVAGLITAEMKVLDLMSSLQSHLPEGVMATGLGMNGEEMQANDRLTEWQIHDLNAKQKLPFTNATFDVVCCHLSFEYLLHPEKIMAETARILKPDGLCIVSFSNRWFPEKVTKIWQQLHDFERMGYVMGNMREYFDDFTTTSFRNWLRPVEDLHYFELRRSDPLFIVTGRKIS